MREYFRYPPERTSMERYRDLRDYALVFGFPHADDLLTYLCQDLQVGDTLLDMGCGSSRAITEASRTLYWQGVYCDALDKELPLLQHRFVRYHKRLFEDTQFEDGVVDKVMSVCGLGMYAESEEELWSHFVELERILDTDGEAWIAVDPAIVTNDPLKRRYLQMQHTNIWVQSPTLARCYFECDIESMIQDVGLMVIDRIIPYGSGGMMIDDEVTLRISKI